MKYLVRTNCLQWHDVGFIVEAESEEEAEDIVRHNAWQLTDIVDEEYVETDYREIKAVKEEEEEYEYR